MVPRHRIAAAAVGVGPQGGIPLGLLNRVRGTLDWWDPEFLDYLAADHDVIVFDNVCTGCSTGIPLLLRKPERFRPHGFPPH